MGHGAPDLPVNPDKIVRFNTVLSCAGIVLLGIDWNKAPYSKSVDNRDTVIDDALVGLEG